MRTIPPISRLLGRSLTLVLLLGGLAAQGAFAQRVVMYWSGPDAGTMEIQQNGVGSAYVEIPDDACGFRLSHDPNPFLWNEVWYFANSYLLGQYAAINSSESWGPADDIRATGPVNGNCQDKNFSFDTPATQSFPGLAAPAGTGAFVAEFYHPDQIEFLDESGVPIDVDIPEPPEAPDPEGPEIDWTIPPSLVNCIQDWENDWHCANDGSSSAVMSAAFAVGRYAERAGWSLDAAREADTRRDHGRLIQDAVDTLAAIDKMAEELGRLVGDFEQDLGRRKMRHTTRKVMKSIAAGTTVARLNLAACHEQAAQQLGVRVVKRDRSSPEADSNACQTASQDAFGIIADVLQLQAFELPAER